MQKARSSLSFEPVIKDSLNRNHVVSTPEDGLQQAVETMKEIMRSKLEMSAHIEELVIIDAIQRSGLEYYVLDEIHAVLAKHHQELSAVEDDSNLHDVALRFRLLRQRGYNVPADMFNKFVDKKGMFNEERRKDLKGLMSLFEASELNIPGDDILEDASEFSRHWLQKMTDIEQAKTGMIRSTLSCPYHKSLPRFMAKNNLHNLANSMNFFHDISVDSNKWISKVQDLARMDLRMAQIYQQHDITQVSRWWKELGLSKELELARSQPVKWLMWSAACLPGAHMANHRLELTKATSFVYIIDDICDVYGTLDELTLFTEAVNKWDYANVEGLPHYMKICLKALFDTTAEMSTKNYDQHGGHPHERLQSAWAELCNAFLVEAKWFASGNMPTSKEYLENGTISTGVGVFCECIFLLLGEETNYDDYNNNNDTLDSSREMASLAARILRLWDDLGSAKDENQNGHDGSFVDCYVNEHEGCSTESALEHVLGIISEAWRRLNEACLVSPSPYSTEYKEAVLNFARMVPVMYNYKDNHQLPGLQKNMNSLLMSEHIEQ